MNEHHVVIVPILVGLCGHVHPLDEAELKGVHDSTDACLGDVLEDPWNTDAEDDWLRNTHWLGAITLMLVLVLMVRWGSVTVALVVPTTFGAVGKRHF